MTPYQSHKFWYVDVGANRAPRVPGLGGGRKLGHGLQLFALGLIGEMHRQSTGACGRESQGAQRCTTLRGEIGTGTLNVVQINLTQE